MHITWKGFFNLAKEAKILNARNPIRFATVGGFIKILIVLVRGFIINLPILLFYNNQNRKIQIQWNLSRSTFPFLYSVIGLVVGFLFMTIYGVVVMQYQQFLLWMKKWKHNGKGVALCCPSKLEKFLENQ